MKRSAEPLPALIRQGRRGRGRGSRRGHRSGRGKRSPQPEHHRRG